MNDPEHIDAVLDELGDLLDVEGWYATFEHGWLQRGEETLARRSVDQDLPHRLTDFVPSYPASCMEEAIEQQEHQRTFLVSVRGWHRTMRRLEERRAASCADTVSADVDRSLRTRPRKTQTDRVQRTLGRLELLGDDAPLSIQEVADIMGRRETVIAQYRPPSDPTSTGKANKWPAAEWRLSLKPLLNAENSDGDDEDDEGSEAHRDGRRIGTCSEAIPPEREGVLRTRRRPKLLAGPPEGLAGDGVVGVGHAGRSDDRARRTRGRRPAQLTPLGGPDQNRR